MSYYNDADQRAIDFINECAEKGLITGPTDEELLARGCDICKVTPVYVGHVTGDAPGLEIHFCLDCWNRRNR